MQTDKHIYRTGMESRRANIRQQTLMNIIATNLECPVRTHGPNLAAKPSSSNIVSK